MLLLQRARDKNKERMRKAEDKEMLMIVPEDKVQHAPQWWNSERYDYCDVIIKDSENNLINRLFKKISHLFA